jgi:hypothetical protein
VERYAKEARGIAEATGDRAEVARSDAILASVATLVGRSDDAAESARESAALYAELGHRLAVR